MPVEEVTERLRNGTLEGHIINDRWYAASKSTASKSAKEINAENQSKDRGVKKDRFGIQEEHKASKCCAHPNSVWRYDGAVSPSS